jgi:tetratricopeptide (TPR) repeat protein
MIIWLDNLRSSDIDSKRLNELQETLSQALVLSANPDDRSRIELCSKLRSLECSNIALVVVEPVIQANPKNLVALTTYAAAHIDIDEAETAYTLLLPWASTQPTNYHSLVTLSRACENLGRHQEAHHYARNAFNSNQNIYTAHRLLKSAAEVEDHLAFEEALTSVDSFLDSQRKLESRNVLLLSAEELVNGNRVDAALLTISSLLSSRFNWKGKDAKRIGKLRRWRDDQLQGRLE